MHFGNLREIFVKIGRDRKLKEIGWLPENAGCIPSAVVMMTTADGMPPAFSESHPKLFLISDLYRVDTEIAEAHADIARSFSKSIIPLLVVPSNTIKFR